MIKTLPMQSLLLNQTAAVNASQMKALCTLQKLMAIYKATKIIPDSEYKNLLSVPTQSLHYKLLEISVLNILLYYIH